MIADVRTALATYLATTLGPTFPTLKVLDVWPTPGAALPPYALAVLVGGEINDEWWPPVRQSVTVGASPSGTVRYTYGRVTIPLQLEAWTQFAAKRDEFARAVHAALNRPPQETFAGAAPSSLRHRRVHGLMLKVGTLFDSPCDYRFGLARPIEDGDAAQSGEWRTQWTGEAALLVTDEQTMTLIKKITVQGLDTEPSIIT